MHTQEYDKKMTEFLSGPGKRHSRVLEEIGRKLGIEVVGQLSPEETVTAEIDFPKAIV